MMDHKTTKDATQPAMEPNQAGPALEVAQLHHQFAILFVGTEFLLEMKLVMTDLKTLLAAIHHAPDH